MSPRPLHLDPADGRPDSALGAHWLTVPAAVGGAVFAVATPLVVTVVALVLIALSGALEWIIELLPDEPVTEEELLLEEEDIIEARFVTLGRDFERELPNRIVPRLSTAPPEPSRVPTEETPDEPMEPPPPQEVEPPPNAVEDVLARIGDRAQAFAEIAEEREREGSPDGIEEGTEREASEGDVYRGRLYSFFRRGWSIPTTLDRDTVQGLTTTMSIQIGPELQIVSFEVRRSSGNALFDQSVTEHLTRLQATDQRIPPPPEEVAAQYIGAEIAVRFSGRQAS